jgi:hypothetical protein
MSRLGAPSQKRRWFTDSHFSSEFSTEMANLFACNSWGLPEMSRLGAPSIPKPSLVKASDQDGIVESSPQPKPVKKVEVPFLKYQNLLCSSTYQNLLCWQCAASVPGQMMICENYGLPVAEPHGREGFTALCPKHHGKVGSSTKYMKVPDIKSIKEVEDSCWNYQDLLCWQCTASVPGKMLICDNYGLPAPAPHGRDGFTALCPEHHGKIGSNAKHMQVADIPDCKVAGG